MRIHDQLQIGTFEKIEAGQLFLAKIGKANQHCLKAYWRHSGKDAPFVVMIEPSDSTYGNKPGEQKASVLQGSHVLILPNSIIVPSSDSEAIDFQGHEIAPGFLVIVAGAGTYLCFRTGHINAYVNVGSGEAIAELPQAARVVVGTWSVQLPVLADHTPAFKLSWE